MERLKRGDIWICDHGTPRRSEMGYRRPVVIVEADDLLSTRLKSTVVVPLTTSQAYAGNASTVKLPAKRCRLKHDSVALTYLVTSVDQSELVERIGPVPRDLMELIDIGLQISLYLQS